MEGLLRNNYLYLNVYSIVMKTKLTLNVNKQIISRAKKYAQEQRTSVSDLVENYLRRLTMEASTQTKITPLVKGLSGIISLPENFDKKKAYTHYLEDKYK